MAVLDQFVAEAFQVVGRNLNSGETSTASATATPATTTTAAPSPSATQGNNTQSGPTSSPLLFFVALGFGVVFTNLWIIVGVKYCFRYNARNRAIRNGEDPDPINMENMPARPHRRRREKKLMTMDEVNERFPLTKYKNWVAARAREGLSTSGGVTAPSSRPGSVRDVDGVVPSSPTETKHSMRPESTATDHDVTISPATNTLGGAFAGDRKSMDAKVAEKGVSSPAVEEHNKLETIPTTAETIKKQTTTNSEEDDDEDDHIHTAVPPELLTTPGDTCAICIDALEDDDDIRGLTCGHAFHAGCLDPWLTSRRACCPLCKADYYTPKPRPEGEQEQPERTGRRRNNMPPAPPSAWLAVRGNRLIIPARFGGQLYGGRDANDRNDVSRASRRARRAAAGAPPGDAAGPVSIGAGQNAEATAPAPRRWAPSNPFRNLRVPFVGGPGGRRAPTAEEQNTATTPSQLESGVVR